MHAQIATHIVCNVWFPSRGWRFTSKRGTNVRPNGITDRERLFCGLIIQRCPQYCYEFHDQLWLFHEGGPSKKGKGTNRTGGSTILKLIRGGSLLYFSGFRRLQPYETWKFRICSESVSGVFPDLFRISLRK